MIIILPRQARDILSYSRDRALKKRGGRASFASGLRTRCFGHSSPCSCWARTAVRSSRCRHCCPWDWWATSTRRTGCTLGHACGRSSTGRRTSGRRSNTCGRASCTTSTSQKNSSSRVYMDCDDCEACARTTGRGGYGSCCGR